MRIQLCWRINWYDMTEERRDKDNLLASLSVVSSFIGYSQSSSTCCQIHYDWRGSLLCLMRSPRSDDRIIHFYQFKFFFYFNWGGGGDYDVGSPNEGFILRFSPFILKENQSVWSGGHLYSCAPPTQVDGDMETIEAIWNVCVLLY